MGAKDEMVGLIAQVAEDECVCDVYGIDIGMRGKIGGERIVVAVEHSDSARGEDRPHGTGLLRCEAYGEEALPVTTGQCTPRPKLVESPGGKMDEIEH